MYTIHGEIIFFLYKMPQSKNNSNLLNASCFESGQTDSVYLIYFSIAYKTNFIYYSRPLQELVAKGVPQPFRGIAWQLLCNAHLGDAKSKYSEYLRMTSPMEKLIRRDSTRTYSEHEFFKEKDGLGQESLFNVMKVCVIWS